MEKYELLMNSFKDEKFRNSLNLIRIEIEKEIIVFLEFLRAKLTPNQRIFENIESRIKGIDSFNEKVRRKGYIDKWNITEDDVNNQELIRTKLPDLIGFRVNCFFIDDEIIIYNILKDYYDKNNFCEKIALNFKENIKGKNGHNIYKVTGQYDLNCNFEIQIKSSVNNIWGEVEHKTVYKNNDYDPKIAVKKSITEEVFNILSASDRQLVSLFSDHYTEKELLKCLFFQMTKETVIKETGICILAEHYERFFEIFSEKEFYNKIKQYVASSMLNIEFDKYETDVVKISDDIKSMFDEIRETYCMFEYEIIYSIILNIYTFKNFDEFLIFFINNVKKNTGLIDAIPEEDSFCDDEDDKQVDNANETMLIYLDSHFNRKDK